MKNAVTNDKRAIDGDLFAVRYPYADKRATSNPLSDLINVATRMTNHINAGSCPDEVEGHDTRDAECPACNAIDRVTKLWIA